MMIPPMAISAAKKIIARMPINSAIKPVRRVPNGINDKERALLTPSTLPSFSGGTNFWTIVVIVILTTGEQNPINTAPITKNIIFQPKRSPGEISEGTIIIKDARNMPINPYTMIFCRGILFGIFLMLNANEVSAPVNWPVVIMVANKIGPPW